MIKYIRQFVLFILIGFVGSSSFDVLAQEASPAPRQQIPSDFIIEALAWSPDGTKIAIGGKTYSSQCGLTDLSLYAVRIVDTVTHQVINFLTGHTCTVVSLDWSRDSTKLVSGSNDGTTRVWDVATGQTISSTPMNSFGSKYSVTWNNDGSKYAMLGGIIDIRDAKNGQRLNSDTFLNAHVSSIDWSPDGTKLLTGYWDDIITLWDAETGQTLQSLKGQHSGAVYQVRWSPDGDKFATAGADNIIRIWDTITAQQLITIQLDSTIGNLSWEATDQLVTGEALDRIRVWDTNTGLQLAFFEYYDELYAVTSSPDGMQVAYAGRYGFYQSTIANITEFSTPIPFATPISTPAPT